MEYLTSFLTILLLFIILDSRTEYINYKKQPYVSSKGHDKSLIIYKADIPIYIIYLYGLVKIESIKRNVECVMTNKEFADKIKIGDLIHRSQYPNFGRNFELLIQELTPSHVRNSNLSI